MQHSSRSRLRRQGKDGKLRADGGAEITLNAFAFSTFGERWNMVAFRVRVGRSNQDLARTKTNAHAASLAAFGDQKDHPPRHVVLSQIQRKASEHLHWTYYIHIPFLCQINKLNRINFNHLINCPTVP